MTTLASPPPPVQTLAVGMTPTARLQRTLGGFTGLNMIPPADRCFFAVCGRSGEGKTAFLQSIPGCFIFNIDPSSTVVRNPPSIIWPGLDPKTGSPIESVDSGTPGSYSCASLGGATVRRLDITHDLILAKKVEILTMARAGDPNTPPCIAVDTVDLWIPLIMKWVVARRGKTVWEEIDGRAGWEEVYSEVTEFVREFRQAGIGVFLSFHLTDKTIRLSGDRSEILRDVTQVTDNFWGRLKPIAQLVGIVEMVPEIAMKAVPRNNPDGSPMRDPKTGALVTLDMPYTKTRVFLTFETVKAKGTAKKRGDLVGRIPLDDKNNGWGAFLSEYNRALAADNSAAPTTPAA